MGSIRGLLLVELLNVGSEISFPFQAIGLLIDNCRLGLSESCSLVFGEWKNSSKTAHKDKYIIIEDFGQSLPIWGNQYEDFLKETIEFGGNTLDKDLAEIDEK